MADGEFTRETEEAPDVLPAQAGLSGQTGKRSHHGKGPPMVGIGPGRHPNTIAALRKYRPGPGLDNPASKWPHVIAKVAQRVNNSMRYAKSVDEIVEAVEKFLDGLRHGAGPTLAGKAAGLDPRHLYEYRAKYPEFAALWDEAKAEYKESLEKLLDERINDETRGKMADILLMFALKKLDPAYKDRAEINITNVQQSLLPSHLAVVKTASDEELRQIVEAQAREVESLYAGERPACEAEAGREACLGLPEAGRPAGG